ncbi:hypothetical protein SODALDRAFT_332414 [Sodiomyces alkalinus F11]|uniref:Uncharacterized protein n=1 Tax=Sodiomyces alkalinus (strain CBS 110278 / VKM F-3762 / F11) TaxID=1314773 RepID=A0A3N2PWV8_SODAK|nr:hypothetical protein SODALDRAFT_332414 [Sodiomyces alkalinus F11]ROT38974.1 hypothetical protein SODALDRAFT_332414 [Sodiomyces alkalinus F11]
MAPIAPRSMNCDQFRVGFITLLTLNCVILTVFVILSLYGMRNSYRARESHSRSGSEAGSRSGSESGNTNQGHRRNEVVDDNDDDTVISFELQTGPRTAEAANFPSDARSAAAARSTNGGVASAPLGRFVTAPQARLHHPTPIPPAQTFQPPFVGRDPRYNGY